MPGFFACNKKINIELVDEFSENCLSDEILSTKHTFKRNTLSRFMDDKVFSEDADILILLDGYLLNKKGLQVKYNEDNMFALIKQMYTKLGETFFNEFRGVYSGLLYDKKEDKWIVWTNHCGESPMFYMEAGNGGWYFGSEVRYLLAAVKEANIELTINEPAIYQMLTYGYMIDDSTYANEIKRLRGGKYIVVTPNGKELKTYHKFQKDTHRFENIKITDAVDIVDEAFKNSVELEYEKDAEYGYKHLTDMSGGLDSRMNAWVAHTLSKKKLMMICYSKAGYLDETVAEEIAQYWNDELLFKPLDDITYLYEIDELTSMLSGLSFYSGITGGKRLLETINISNYGLEHTGMIGDVVIGSFCKNVSDNKVGGITKFYSNTLADRVTDLTKQEEGQYQDHEIFLLYTRGIQSAAATYLIRRNYTEVSSPFMNVDFLQTCLDLPLNLRYGHYLYKKWIKAKYPDAANFVWEKISGKITEPQWLIFLRRCVKRGPNVIKRFLGLGGNVSFQMNPLDYWVKRNDNFQQYMNSYYADAVSKYQSHVSASLASDMDDLFTKGNMIEKSMVLTVYSSIKLYFDN